MKWPNFIVCRWRGAVPLSQVFWTDMVIVGTAVNLVATLAAMFLFSRDAPVVLSAATYFSPLLLNVFLVVAVWRSAASASPTVALAARAAAIAWLVAATAL